MDRIFKALADPTRRHLLDRLRADNGQTLGALCEDLAISRQSTAEHLAVLEGAGLLTTVRRGREKLHYVDPGPLHEIHERWLARFDKPKVVHVTYIATKPEQLWTALTDPELTAEYWGHRNVSGWTNGDTREHRRLGDGTPDLVGTILEIDPPRRLSHSWAPAADPARRSRVTFDLEPVGDVVRLTVTHEDLPPEQVDGTNEGWAKVLSSLKSLLETGRPLRNLV